MTSGGLAAAGGSTGAAPPAQGLARGAAGATKHAGEAGGACGCGAPLTRLSRRPPVPSYAAGVEESAEPGWPRCHKGPSWGAAAKAGLGSRPGGGRREMGGSWTAAVSSAVPPARRRRMRTFRSASDMTGGPALARTV